MPMDQTVELLKTLSEAHAVTGCEDDLREIIAARLAPLATSSRTDALGNLIVELPTTAPDDAPLLMLDAHMDEIGLIVSFIEPNGYLRFATIGGWDERVLPSHAVDVRTYDGQIMRGVIGTPPPHILKPEERSKPFTVESLFIDIGARNAEEVATRGVAVGDSVTISYPFHRLTPDVVMGKALDNRAGCTVLISVLERLLSGGQPADLPVRLVAVFSTREEIGGFGARVASYDIRPDIALVLEGTVAADCPGVPAARMPSRQGNGPAITHIDRSAISPRRLVKFVEQLADDNGIAHQQKTPIFGGTNAGPIHTAHAGVPVMVLSVPCRYIHSAHATLRVDDLRQTIDLATLFVQQCDRYLRN